MKYLLSVIAVLFLWSCKNESEKNQSTPQVKTQTATQEMSTLELGKKIFNGKGQCLVCHKPSQKVIGPSIVEIVTIYKEQDADMVEFLKGNLDPIVDPSQYQVMKTNLEITKKMSDQELNAVKEYMFSFLEK